ncbi:MAG: zinc-ribbon domain containing protein [Oscillospiraceae bacterium]
MKKDKTLVCKDCGNSFVFTASEQEFYEEKGLTSEPGRCKDCRAARKNGSRNDNRRSSNREMYPAVCASCGKRTQVPFKPSGDRPVYCSDCFSRQR